MSPELQAALTHLLNQVNTVGDQMPLALSEYLRWSALSDWIGVGVGLAMGGVGTVVGWIVAQEDTNGWWVTIIGWGCALLIGGCALYDLYGVYYAPHAYLVHNLLKVG